MLTLPFSGWKEIAAQSERLQISQGLVDWGCRMDRHEYNFKYPLMCINADVALIRCGEAEELDFLDLQFCPHL